MSKGSHRRPQQVSSEQMMSNWQKIFAQEVCPECGCTDISSSHHWSADDVKTSYKQCQECGHHFEIGA